MYENILNYIFKTKWESKTSNQNYQKGIFGEWLPMFVHDLSFLHELQSEFMDDMV